MDETTEQTHSFSSLHGRTGAAIGFILGTVGLTNDKIMQIVKIARILKHSPPIPAFGPLAQLSQLQEYAKLIPDFDLTSTEPGAYLANIPEERIAFFLKETINRLEWVLHGNPSETIAIETAHNDAENRHAVIGEGEIFSRKDDRTGDPSSES